VGGYDPRDSNLTPVWGVLAEAGTPVVVHCGNGPERGRHTGAQTFAEVLAAHPRLTAVIAHAGAPEYSEHIALAEAYPNVHLDTTMVGTAYLGQTAPIPADAVKRLGDMPSRVVLGSDFPNIPHPFAEQVVALERFGLGDEWLRAVCWHNGARLLQV
jgi:predicted TIM-barrel fold metal-dependent hydrolase